MVWTRARAQRTESAPAAWPSETGSGPTSERLVCHDLTKSFGPAFTLGPLNLDLSPGVTCLVGPNGAGKSTFFRLAAGIERPTGGALSRASAGARPGSVGYLPQNPQFPGAATCRDFLAYVGWLQMIPAQSRQRAISAALRTVNLEPMTNRRIRDLSGGMRRRLGIAQALVHQPTVVLLDEPTVALDPLQRSELRGTIAGLSGDRIVLVSTHLVEDVRGLADRVVVLDEGSVTFDGTVPELESHADPRAPGHTSLEQALSTVMGGRR